MPSNSHANPVSSLVEKKDEALPTTAEVLQAAIERLQACLDSGGAGLAAAVKEQLPLLDVLEGCRFASTLLANLDAPNQHRRRLVEQLEALATQQLPGLLIAALRSAAVPQALQERLVCIQFELCAGLANILERWGEPGWRDRLCNLLDRTLPVLSVLFATHMPELERGMILKFSGHSQIPLIQHLLEYLQFASKFPTLSAALQRDFRLLPRMARCCLMGTELGPDARMHLLSVLGPSPAKPDKLRLKLEEGMLAMHALRTYIERVQTLVAIAISGQGESQAITCVVPWDELLKRILDKARAANPCVAFGGGMAIQAWWLNEWLEVISTISRVLTTLSLHMDVHSGQAPGIFRGLWCLLSQSLGQIEGMGPELSVPSGEREARGVPGSYVSPRLLPTAWVVAMALHGLAEWLLSPEGTSMCNECPTISAGQLLRIAVALYEVVQQAGVYNPEVQRQAREARDAYEVLEPRGAADAEVWGRWLDLVLQAGAESLDGGDIGPSGSAAAAGAPFPAQQAMQAMRAMFQLMPSARSAGASERLRALHQRRQERQQEQQQQQQSGAADPGSVELEQRRRREEEAAAAAEALLREEEAQAAERQRAAATKSAKSRAKRERQRQQRQGTAQQAEQAGGETATAAAALPAGGQAEQVPAGSEAASQVPQQAELPQGSRGIAPFGRAGIEPAAAPQDAEPVLSPAEQAPLPGPAGISPGQPEAGASSPAGLPAGAASVAAEGPAAVPDVLLREEEGQVTETPRTAASRAETSRARRERQRQQRRGTAQQAAAAGEAEAAAAAPQAGRQAQQAAANSEAAATLVAQQAGLAQGGRGIVPGGRASIEPAPAPWAARAAGSPAEHAPLPGPAATRASPAQPEAGASSPAGLPAGASSVDAEEAELAALLSQLGVGSPTPPDGGAGWGMQQLPPPQQQQGHSERLPSLPTQQAQQGAAAEAAVAAAGGAAAAVAVVDSSSSVPLPPTPAPQGKVGARPPAGAGSGAGAEEADEDLCCPITMEPMCDPVMAADGHTYERAAIEAWLAHNATSPVTNLPLPHTQLQPNHFARRIIAARLGAAGRGGSKAT